MASLEKLESALDQLSEPGDPRDQGMDSAETNYTTLLSMFPNVQASYIREICDNPPFNVFEEERLLDMLINHLLNYKNRNNDDYISFIPDEGGEVCVNDVSSDEVLLELIKEDEDRINEAITNDHVLSEMLQMEYLESMEQERCNQEALNEQLFAEFLQQDKEIVDEKLKILENILPDYNPEALKKYVEENSKKANSLEVFVESNLLNKNYEKRDQYFSKLKNKENIEKYLTNFKVEEFLKEFPEPFEYFENPERTRPYQEKALDFLKKRYSNYTQFVRNIYVSNKHNLSIADNNLQTQLRFNPLALLNIEVDIPLMQEIAFIQNKETIKNHLEVIKEKEERELKLLRAQNLLLECQCCYDDLKPHECIECENNHIFCKKCVIKGTTLAMSNGEVVVLCFAGCKKEIPLNILRRILPEPNFDTLLKKRQEIEIAEAKIRNLVTCPFCPYSEEVDPEIKIFSCKNLECMKISCRLCKKMNHLPIKCEDLLDEHKGRLYIEEEMSKALIRKCYNCKKPFVKDGGCNSMACICGAAMCYICNTPFTSGTHHSGRCGTDGHRFDEMQVENSRVQATTKLRRDFPDLNLFDV